ncbi:hypothetical protein [Vibrio parahaemolyticus]|uniref:hypothetical protein n=1 Tax=Vibrio parahaemolyticus TaxID=670 RepID=UPI0004712E8E|nr:hypothetical protein [Vibrio parahaemolyticus]HAV1390484.1 hypothetical protein [Vibrio parahaemolyticus]
MFAFDMSIQNHYASFRCDETDKRVFVDSFDNEVFDVRFGTVDSSQRIGEIIAHSDEELNNKLQELINSVGTQNDNNRRTAKPA